MRSFSEIRFRLRQELGNLRLLAASRRNAPSQSRPEMSRLPDPAAFLMTLKGTRYAVSTVNLAEGICAHRFPLLGYVIETGPEIRWRRDYVRGIETPTGYFRRIPYLNAAAVGDHKLIWELNRHQHLIVLAQAWLLTGRREFLDEIPRQIESWWKQNPFLRGINWASALEVAFRALSWIWILHLCGENLTADFQRRLSRSIADHGAYLENNLSVYFSPNTHLLGEAVALHAIGAIFPDHPRSVHWRKAGGQIVEAEMMNQVRADGSHFEQSSAYHVYALDFFLFHALLADVGQPYRERLRKMADYLAALCSEDGWIPLLGDDDGGNLFHPYGNQRQYAGRTLAACCAFFETADWPCQREDLNFQSAWWLGERAFATRQPSGIRGLPVYFPDAGIAVLSKAPSHLTVDTKAFGHAGAGHSHAHALSVVCRSRGRDVLIDPGAYTYTSEPEWRSRFRGTAFHNTLRIDGLDQADQAGPFRWSGKPATKIVRWSCRGEWCYLHAVCSYRQIRHERHFVWLSGPETLVIADVVKSADGAEHLIEQFWHCGSETAEMSPCSWRIGGVAVLSVPVSSHARIESGGILGWESEVPGCRVQRPAIVIHERTKAPAVLAAALFLQIPPAGICMRVESSGSRIIVRGAEGRSIELSENNEPVILWS